MRFWVSIMAVLALAAPIAGEEQTVLFLGDSLTAGYGLDASEAYPALIQQRLQADGLAWKVVNAGKSGDTTKGGLARLPWLMRSEPDLVVVALGANDGLRGLPVASTRENLVKIGERLDEQGIHVVYAGMKLPTNLGKEYITEFSAIFVEIAEQLGVPLYPFLLDGVAADPDLNQADGIHPNAAGQQVIADRVYDFLKPVLQAVE